MIINDIVLILGAVGGFVTLLTGQVILILKVLKADERREQIAEAVLDPSVTALPPKT